MNILAICVLLAVVSQISGQKKFEEVSPGGIVVGQQKIIEITTPNNYTYHYLSDYGMDLLQKKYVVFRVKAGNDAHITLSKTKGNWLTNSYEILIGGWNNQKSAIRNCHQCNPVVEITHNIMDENVFKSFWISWYDYNIRVGSGEEVFRNEFLSWTDPNPHQINFIGVSTGWGAHGQWIFGSVDGGWSDWSSWSPCPVTCGGSTYRRTRVCDNPTPIYGASCMGPDLETETCGDVTCGVDGGWGEWTYWTECSVTCGGGKRSRLRRCDNPPPKGDGLPCQGAAAEEETCQAGLCPVDGKWAPWGQWSKCSLTCGTGTQDRSRTCTDPPPVGKGQACQGLASEERSCSVQVCPVDGNWGEWNSWTSCSVSCGQGVRTRDRKCDDPPPVGDGLFCQGVALEQETCLESACPVDGNWASWTTWSSCSVTCGNGLQRRQRSCDNPAPIGTGLFCRGDSFEQKICQEVECAVDGNWSEWSLWATCSRSCGSGTQTRQRSCDSPTPSNGGKSCDAPGYERKSCFLRTCPVDGQWSEWQPWGACSKPCGNGEHERRRFCDSPTPSEDGLPCPGLDFQSGICLRKLCPVNGNWAEWGAWGACSRTCGFGLESRVRTCSNPNPENGGDSCPGPSNQQQTCLDRTCPVNGNWSEWNSWAQCSHSCGRGYQLRKRLCSEPPAQNGGESCSGPGLDIKSCLLTYCSVDGSWGQWSGWAECTETCGPGVRRRLRACNNPPPIHNGTACPGNDTQTIPCEIIVCSRDGNWSEWTSWSACSVTCGSGHSYRQRLCDDPEPLGDGRNCSGDGLQTRICSNVSCAVDGGFTDWSPWTQCSASCGPGKQSRARWCVFPSPSNGGRQCTGVSVEVEDCLDRHCPINGNYTIWGPWSACSVSCGGGSRERYRNCTNPTPQYGGLDCFGPSYENDSCGYNECPVLSKWAQWSQWSPCTQSCDGGFRYRNRTCGGIDPFNSPCPGQSFQNFTCNIVGCPMKFVRPKDKVTAEAKGAAGIGIAQFIVMGILLAVIVIIDMTSVVNHLRYMRRNIRDFRRTLRYRKAKYGSYFARESFVRSGSARDSTKSASGVSADPEKSLAVVPVKSSAKNKGKSKGSKKNKVTRRPKPNPPDDPPPEASSSKVALADDLGTDQVTVVIPDADDLNDAANINSPDEAKVADATKVINESRIYYEQEGIHSKSGISAEGDAVQPPSGHEGLSVGFDHPVPPPRPDIQMDTSSVRTPSPEPDIVPLPDPPKSRVVMPTIIQDADHIEVIPPARSQKYRDIRAPVTRTASVAGMAGIAAGALIAATRRQKRRRSSRKTSGRTKMIRSSLDAESNSPGSKKSFPGIRMIPAYLPRGSPTSALHHHSPDISSNSHSIYLSRPYPYQGRQLPPIPASSPDLVNLAGDAIAQKHPSPSSPENPGPKEVTSPDHSSSAHSTSPILKRSPLKLEHMAVPNIPQHTPRKTFISYTRGLTSTPSPRPRIIRKVRIKHFNPARLWRKLVKKRPLTFDSNTTKQSRFGRVREMRDLLVQHVLPSRRRLSIEDVRSSSEAPPSYFQTNDDIEIERRRDVMRQVLHQTQSDHAIYRSRNNEDLPVGGSTNQDGVDNNAFSSPDFHESQNTINEAQTMQRRLSADENNSYPEVKPYHDENNKMLFKQHDDDYLNNLNTASDSKFTSGQARPRFPNIKASFSQF